MSIKPNLLLLMKQMAEFLEERITKGSQEINQLIHMKDQLAWLKENGYVLKRRFF